MTSDRFIALGLGLLVVVQGVAAYELLSWAFAQMAGQPMLGHAADSAAARLRDLAAQDPGAFRRLQGIDKNFLWFFHQHGEAVALAAKVGLICVLGALVSATLAARLLLGGPVTYFLMGLFAVALMFGATAIFASLGNPAWPLLLAGGLAFLLGTAHRYRQAAKTPDAG